MWALVMQHFRLVVLILCLLGSVPIANGLTNHSGISVLTYEPGTELYTLFGHTALRVQDSVLGIDLVYNFGTFDFRPPLFYFQFLGGKLNYALSISQYDAFLKESIIEKRTVHEQTLRLSLTERITIYRELNRIYHSNERCYKYDFFYDNCATRIRDLIWQVVEQPPAYDTASYCCTSFRDLLNPYTAGKYWVRLGINFVLGREADRTASSSDFMFLPDYVYHILEDTGIVSKTETIINTNSGKKSNLQLIVLVFVALTLIVLAIWPVTGHFVYVGYTAIFTLMGVFLLALSLFSANQAFGYNLNILWTLPALLVLATKKKAHKITKWAYLMVLAIASVLSSAQIAAFSWTFLPWIFMMIMMVLMDLLKPKQMSLVLEKDL
jgi:hypothetical protein